MVVDLSRTDPEGFDDALLKNNIDHYSDAIIWEVHVRDFSNKIADSQYKGKYLAFTERGLVNEHGEPIGVDYLVNLEGAELTIRTAIMAGCSKEFVLKWVYDDEDEYNRCYADLIAEGEILPDEDDN
jgi:pullulanase